MPSTLTVIAPPAVEPVTLEEALHHCRIDQSADDMLVTGLITAARTMAEMYLSRALITQTLQWTYQPQSPIWRNGHHLRGTLDLPRAPAQSISSVTVLDTRGNSTTIPSATLPIAPPALLTGYIFDQDLDPAHLTIGGVTILSDGRPLHWAELQHLQVVFQAGYGDAATAVPKPVITAILLTIAYLYENRGDEPAEMPKAIEWLLNPFRNNFLA